MESLGITKQRRAFHYYTFYTIYMRQLNPDNLTEFSNSALVVDLFVFGKKKTVDSLSNQISADCNTISITVPRKQV